MLQHKGWSTPQTCRWMCWSSLWPSAASAAAHPGIFDAHCQSTHRYHYLPRRDNQRHSCIMKQSTHNPPGANRNRACLSANSPCGNINYGNGVYFKVGVLDRMDNKWLKSQRMAHWHWACMKSFKLHRIPAECCTNFSCLMRHPSTLPLILPLTHLTCKFYLTTHKMLRHNSQIKSWIKLKYLHNFIF